MPAGNSFFFRGQYVRIIQVILGHVEYVNVGGGMSRRVDASEFWAEAEQKNLHDEEMVWNTFYFDDGPEFQGYHNPYVRWNGWEVPYFTQDVAIKVIKQYLEDSEAEPEVLISAHGAQLMFTDPWAEGEAAKVSIDATTITYKGEELQVYNVVDGWCWNAKGEGE